MKLVPAFFLFALSITHLIYVIAVPNAELERAKTREAAAIIRFYKSKRYAPVRFHFSCRNHIEVRIRNYMKYTRIMAKLFFSFAKARFETRIVDLHSVLLKYLPSGLLRKLSSRNSQEHKHRSIRGLVLEKQEKTNRCTYMKQYRRTTEGVQKTHRWPVLKITASVYETFKQVAQEFVLRMQGMAVMEVPKSMMQYLSETCSHFGAISRIAEQMAMGFPIISQKPQTQPQEELASSEYNPIPSAAPSVELSPKAYPQTAAGQGLEQAPETLFINASASPETTDTSLDNAILYSGPVVTFRRLVRVVAKV